MTLTFPLFAHAALPTRAVGPFTRVARLVETLPVPLRIWLSRREALWKHAFRNALLPLITLLGLVLPGLLSGSVIIERIFAWPGLGRLYFDSILSRDYPVVLALSLVGAVATLAVTLAADIAYAVADPRVRDGTGP